MMGSVMVKLHRRHQMLLLAVGMLLFTVIAAAAAAGAPVLLNPDFECEANYHPQNGIIGMVPDGWTAVLLDGNPSMNSTRMEIYQECTREDNNSVEKLSGYDSYIFKSQDIETPPQPGKPFDTLIHQRTAVTPGVAYSLSGWMVSLCGGSSQTNPCPADYYMAKMAGLDPAGGTNALAPGVLWVEDRRNFTEARWVNLRLAARAEGPWLTVFARMRSPFQWHGNHAFADAFSLLRAPTAQIVGLPASTPGHTVLVRWIGDLGPDIPTIPGGKYSLLFDVQYRQATGPWVDWLSGQTAGEAEFVAPGCGSPQFAFRVRPRAEQLVAGGCWPNHRYPGVWSDPAQIVLGPGDVCVPRAYLPGLWR
jgi:hypothetical protein